MNILQSPPLRDQLVVMCIYSTNVISNRPPITALSVKLQFSNSPQDNLILCIHSLAATLLRRLGATTAAGRVNNHLAHLQPILHIHKVLRLARQQITAQTSQDDIRAFEQRYQHITTAVNAYRQLINFQLPLITEALIISPLVAAVFAIIGAPFGMSAAITCGSVALLLPIVAAVAYSIYQKCFLPTEKDCSHLFVQALSPCMR